MDVVIQATIHLFRYPGAAEPALAGIDLTIQRGEFVLIVGPAGAGKTTLCYCLTGVCPKSVSGDLTGQVVVAGRDLATLSLPQTSPLMGLVLQSPENQLFNVTVAEDVAFGPENLGLPPAEVAHRVQRCLEFTGASHLASRFSHLLSGGQSQRVVLASVLALGADILVFDQPAAELDPAGRRAIYENIARLNREAGKTVILVEDKLDQVVAYASRIILLDGGHVVRDCPPDAFFVDSAIEAYGVRLPDTVRLYHALRDTGLTLRRLPLTVDDLVEQVQPLLPSVAYPPEGSEPSRGSSANATVGPPVIEIVDLTYRYPAGVEALTDVTLRVRQGEFVALLGENGAGKTTLAKHLVGLLRPTRGHVRIQGQDIARLPIHHISQWVGFLFQDPDYQTFNNSCLEEVAYGLKLRRLSAAEVEARALDALDRVGLAEWREAHPYTLSRGQRQRLAVATVLALEPAILVVDEPSTGLDYRETLAMMDMLEAYRQAGGTVLIITHDLEMAARYAQRIVIMAAGRIQHDIAADRIQELYDELAASALALPDVAHLVRRLGLPPHVRSVADVAACVREMARLNGSPSLNRRSV